MNMQRKLTLVVATGAVALGAGHFVQKRAADRMAAAPAEVSAVEPLAAGPDVSAMPKIDVTAPILVAKPATLPPSATVVRASDPVIAEISTTELPQTEVAEKMANCTPQLDLIAQPGAMIGLTLLAPCNPDERVVLRHEGLAVTGRTTASGAYFATVPALTSASQVQIVFGSGESIAASIDIPEATKTNRFGVQWQEGDDFQLNAFEHGANYNQPGHISAAFTGTAGDGGFLTILGDATTALPLLAEVYTFASDSKADVIIEAAVTERTCGREILGETLNSSEGRVEITDLILAMPDCDAIGDILVLKNPDEGMKLAAAN